uniref:Putative secreted protein n=1 Tax=Anopheles marajoara TaxID=58244 RepID=A0A2M4CBJ6_9DIPT
MLASIAMMLVSLTATIFLDVRGLFSPLHTKTGREPEMTEIGNGNRQLCTARATTNPFACNLLHLVVVMDETRPFHKRTPL